MKRRSAIAMSLAAALLLPANAHAVSVSDFSDFPSDWSAQALESAVENGLLNGSGGRINASGSLTRAEMAAIVNRAFGSSNPASLSGYSDVSPDAWYYEDMAKAVQMGSFQGADGKLNPSARITREEAFTVLSRAFLLDEGDTAVLNQYDDSADISSWARSSMAAMVENGYVHGAGGSLNPKGNITRAEFAQVMDNIAESYVSQAGTVSRDASGNVIVRAPGAVLEDMTVDGDVILADGVGTGDATLNSVTVQGRLIIRGGGEQSVHLNNCTIENGVVLANPNGATRLVPSGSPIPALEVRTDAVIDGDITAITVSEEASVTVQSGTIGTLTVETDAASTAITVSDGASVSTIQANADGVSVHGGGSVGTVQANADNIEITTPGTRVTAAEGADGVTAAGVEVAGGQTAQINNSGTGASVSGGTSSGGSSSSGSSSGGGGSSSGGGSTTPEQVQFVNADQTGLVDLGWSQYVAVRFTDGNSLADCTLTVDGTDVTSAFTPVTDDSSIVKWEVSSLNPAELTVTKAGQSQTVTLSGNSAPAEPVVVEDTAPAYMIAHGPLAYWDYYLTNYDDDGNLRVEPAKTTFSLSDDVVSDVPAFYSPDAELCKGDSFGEVKGEAVIMFNYKTDAEKAWFDAIPDNQAQTVQLVSYDGNKTTLNDSLTYEKAAGISHGGGSVGQITVALGQENFRTNGRYYIRIRSAGHDTALVPIHVVNEQAPTLKLSGPGTVQSGQNVSFEIENMTYGITDPTYAAELKRPDGETVALEVITDWYQFGNRLTLYNDESAENGRNNIPYNGSYTLTVHSNGFKDMSITFNVTGGKDAPQKNALMTVDAISRATGGGTSGGESGSGGGSISANLKFDADLLINAKVLNELCIENEAAQGINDRWKDDMAGWDSVWTEDGQPYDWNDYITAVNNARNEGKYLTFAEYTKTADQDQSGTPYAIKAVLEDNMLGDIQYNGEWVGQAAPALTLVNPDESAADAVTEGNDVVLTADDGAYFSALERINVNGNPMDLSAGLYQVDGNKLTIDSRVLTLGERNTVTLYAEGYRANRLSILYQKTLEQNLSLSTNQNNYDRGENIVITVNNSEGDFLEHLTNVTLHKPRGNTAKVDAQGVQSNTEYYTVSGNTLTIVDTQGTLLNENGQYSVTLEAEYYNQLTTPAFTVQGDLKAAPQPETGGKDGENYTLTFDTVPYDWENSLSVTVNGQAYTENTDWLSNVSAGEFEWSTGAYGGNVLTMHPDAFASGENTITLSAAGYEPMTVKVSGATGEIMTDGGGTEEPEPEPGEDQTPPAVAKIEKVESFFETYYRVSFESSPAAYLSALEDGEAVVTVNDEICEYAIMFLGGKEYKISKDDYANPTYLDFSKDCFSTDGNTVVKISVEGYTDLTFTVDKDGQLVAGDTPEGAAEVPAYEWEYSMVTTFSGHKLYFDRTGNAEEAAKAYLSAVTNVQVGETVYTACTGYFLEDGQYKIVKVGTDKYIELSDSAFNETENTKIHIEAVGYKDLNLTVTAGGELVTE